MDISIAPEEKHGGWGRSVEFGALLPWKWNSEHAHWLAVRGRLIKRRLVEGYKAVVREAGCKQADGSKSQ